MHLTESYLFTCYTDCSFKANFLLRTTKSYRIILYIFDGQANEACRQKYLHVCYVFGQTCIFGEVPLQSETYTKWLCQLMRSHFQRGKGRKECEPAAVVTVA